MPHRKTSGSNGNTQHLDISGLTVEVQRKAIKNLHLRVRAPHGSVHVSAPRRLSNRAIQAMIESRLDWIERQQTTIRQRTAQRTVFDPVLADGQTFELLGQTLSVREVTGQNHGLSQIAPKLHLECNDTELLFARSGPIDAERSRQILRGLYRQQLHRVICERIGHWQGITGVRARFVGIKRMKTRWGSCNIRDARIWLNLELARMPIGCIDHVLVHELTHLHERLHNARFHALMDRFMPDWRRWSDELDRRGMAGL